LFGFAVDMYRRTWTPSHHVRSA